MTNDLNSVLIEGHVIGKVTLSYNEDGTPVCDITIASYRQTKKTGERAVVTTTRVPTVVYGALAKNCAEYLSDGRGVRVVGYLSTEPATEHSDATLVLVAEHVEFRPKKNVVLQRDYA